MAHRSSNKHRNRWVVSLLDVQPTDRVLEIGFGPGLAIAELSRRATRGMVYGIDHSAVMLKQATKHNAAAIRAQRVKLVQASSEQLPPFDEPLDAALAVNSLGFWPQPTQRLIEVRALLRPGGRIAIATQPRCPGATRPKPPDISPTSSVRPASPGHALRPSTSSHLSSASSPAADELSRDRVVAQHRVAVFHARHDAVRGPLHRRSRPRGAHRARLIASRSHSRTSRPRPG
jgi:SAM-dependent methyltransferase